MSKLGFLWIFGFMLFLILASNMLLLAMVWEQENGGYGGIMDGVIGSEGWKGFKDECL